ncbi:MAG: hypothetical protein IKA36_01105 [Clostridia bacterium]|nr:hypothetical protein [Clostridia bacterium]
MGFIKKIIEKNEEKQQKLALKYMYDRLKIGTCGRETMQEYFDHHYRANCYYYSTYILLCMKPTDVLVRGIIHKEYDAVTDVLVDYFNGKRTPNYEHGWIEFEFKGKWYVYDDHYKYPLPKSYYYKKVAPYEIYKRFTQKELINHLLTNHRDKIDLTEEGNKKAISTYGLWDKEYNIPFYDMDLTLVGDEICQANVEVRRKKVNTSLAVKEGERSYMKYLSEKDNTK